MRNLLALVGALVLTVGVAGYYLDWYRVARVPNADGKQSFNVDVNTVKIRDDLSKGTGKVQELIGNEKSPSSNSVPNQAIPTPLNPLLPQTPAKNTSGDSKTLQFELPITGPDGAVKVDVPLPKQFSLPGGTTFKPFGGEESELHGPPADFSRPR